MISHREKHITNQVQFIPKTTMGTNKITPLIIKTTTSKMKKSKSFNLREAIIQMMTKLITIHTLHRE